MELESLLIMSDALSDHVQTADAASMLLRSSSSLSSAAAAATPSSSSAAAAPTLPAPAPSTDTDVLSACLTLCSFSDRDIAYHALMLLQSIVRHPRVSTAFMDRGGLDILLPLTLPPAPASGAGGAGGGGTFFTGPFCSLMLR